MAKTSSLEGALDVRFGSKADICSAKGMSALPQKRTCAVHRRCPLSANSGHRLAIRSTRQHVRAADLVSKAKRLCGREIDEELKVGRLYDR